MNPASHTLQVLNAALQTAPSGKLLQTAAQAFSNTLGVGVLVLTRQDEVLAACGNSADATLASIKASASAFRVQPVQAHNQHAGSVVIYQTQTPDFDEETLLCAPWLAAVAISVLSGMQSTAHAEAERLRKTVYTALSALTFSELEAVACVFEALPTGEGLVVAAKIAERMGITRSAIVNGLRKLEGAFVIETRSQGMKGTFIRILNPFLKRELVRFRA